VVWFAAMSALAEVHEATVNTTDTLHWLGRTFLDHAPSIAVLLVAAWIGLRATKIVGARIVDHARSQKSGDHDESVRRAETLAMILGYTAKICVFVLVVLGTLREFGTDVGPLVTGAGVIGVVVGLGAQSIVKDVLTGVFIFTENQFQIGDAVELGGKAGVVEEINLRTTMLRSADGAVHIIPNGQINVATNFSYHWSKAVVDLQIGYDADLDLVLKLLQKTSADAKADVVLGKDLLEEPVVTGPEAFSEIGMKVTVSAKTPPLRQWEVARQLRRRIRTAFDAAGIGVPVQQRMIHVRSGEAIRPSSGASSERNGPSA
jgi:small-conductance mechanosensitive channel